MERISVDRLRAGARNLLQGCSGARPGEHILIVGEAGADTYFDPEICHQVAGVAESLGMWPEIILERPVSDATEFPASVRDAMAQADRTIFFSRLGDQVRFSLDKGKSRAVMTYTLDPGYLAAPFATADFGVMKRIHDALLERILAAREYRITGPCGTDLVGRINPARGQAVASFALELFPVMIFPPVVCHDLSGTLSIRHFVTSSSTRAYEDSTLVLDTPIMAHVDTCRMVEFDGPEDLVRRLDRQLERAASLTGGDSRLVNSWHTGINPGTYFTGDPYADLELWGTVAYGSPRYTHMHLAGKDPGDAAFHLMDLTIAFDDEKLWDRGRFIFLDRPEIQEMMTDDLRSLLNSSVLNDIGL
jgi:hypothetical protein